MILSAQSVFAIKNEFKNIYFIEPIDGSKKITTKILFQKLNLIKIHFLTSEHLIRLDFFSAGRGGGSAKVAGAFSQPRGHEIMSWAV